MPFGRPRAISDHASQKRPLVARVRPRGRLEGLRGDLIRWSELRLGPTPAEALLQEEAAGHHVLEGVDSGRDVGVSVVHGREPEPDHVGERKSTTTPASMSAWLMPRPSTCPSETWLPRSAPGRGEHRGERPEGVDRFDEQLRPLVAALLPPESPVFPEPLRSIGERISGQSCQGPA
jgi:hypothetical protein